MNARLGRQECQSLVIYRCGKKGNETNRMSIKEKVGALLPNGTLSPSQDPKESLCTMGKRFCN